MIQITTLQNIWLIRQVSSLTSKTYLSNSFHLSKTRHLQVTMTMAEDSTEKRQYQVPSKQQTVPTLLSATNMFRQFPVTHGSQLWLNGSTQQKLAGLDNHLEWWKHLKPKKRIGIFGRHLWYLYQRWCGILPMVQRWVVIESPTSKIPLGLQATKRSCWQPTHMERRKKTVPYFPLESWLFNDGILISWFMK